MILINLSLAHVVHYCRNFNCGGHNPFTTVGKRLRHGAEVTVNRDLTMAGLGARCGKHIYGKWIFSAADALGRPLRLIDLSQRAS
jgi:hypothetical protein